MPFVFAKALVDIATELYYKHHLGVQDVLLSQLGSVVILLVFRYVRGTTKAAALAALGNYLTGMIGRNSFERPYIDLTSSWFLMTFVGTLAFALAIRNIKARWSALFVGGLAIWPLPDFVRGLDSGMLDLARVLVVGVAQALLFSSVLYLGISVGRRSHLKTG